MNIKALITTLVLVGSSSVAMARPVTYSASAEAQWSFGYNSTPTVRDHRASRPIYRPAPMPVSYERDRWNNSRWEDGYRYQPQPQPLLLEAELMFEDHEYRKDIVVGADKGRFNSITIAADGGHTYVMKVGVEFMDRSTQVVQVNRALRGDQAFSFDLSGRDRGISRIFVYRADGPGALNMNLPHHGEFVVTAL